jgi:NitT/TauT family transport system substrate-binding protein
MKYIKVILIYLIFIVISAGITTFSYKAIYHSKDEKNVVESRKPQKDVLNLSLDEWIGWKPILDANGGTETKPGSIYDKLGLKLNINIVNDATQSSNALIKGDLNAAGYTVNRYAFLYDKFISNKVPVKMCYITNFSTGGDGIISKKEITNIEGLVGKKVGVPKLSEAQTLTYWLLDHSNLTKEEKDKIKSQLVMFDTPDDAAKAFFAGELDAAATWQPYLSQASENVGARILFSTKAATNIILDGIVFRDDYIKAHPENVSKFIQGAFEANSLYKTEFKPIKETMPLFTTETDDSIKEMTDDATLADYSTNVYLLKDTAKVLFADMSNIWVNIGEKADPKYKDEAFDDSILKQLQGKFPETKPYSPQFTQDDTKTASKMDDKEALMKTTLSINFDTNSASIKSESYEELIKFADAAKVLNGVVIQIEGNTDNVGGADLNKTLSYNRAKSVALYLQYQSIDPNRFVVVGNGMEKPVATNDTEDGKAQNRRTDIYFKYIGNK